MIVSPPAVPAADGAGGAPAPAPVSDPASDPVSDWAPDPVAELLARSGRANAALMRGDLEGYRALVTYSDDFTLMSPFGGPPSRAADYTPERLAALGRFFRNGRFAQELVQAYACADMVVLALIERQNVEVGGLPPQDWALRVTLVYRRDGDTWRLAHRHADPLAAGVTLQEAAALARGAATAG